MPPIIEGPPTEHDAKPRLVQRLMWFALLWLAGLVSVAAVAYAMRAALKLG